MPANDPKQQFILRANYELFVLLVILLSMVNSLLWLFPLEARTRSVIQLVEYGISLFLLGDFFARWLRARPKGAYLVGAYGWLDLVGSLPLFGLRLARLVKMLLVGRKMGRADLSKIRQVVVERRAGSTLLLVIFVVLLIFEMSGIAILQAEAQNPRANIRSAPDALWWAYVTVATVGYGDYYPVTTGGRVVGAFLMTAGVGLFSVITSYLADWFRRPRRRHEFHRPHTGASASHDVHRQLDEIQRLLDEHMLQQQRSLEELRLRLEEIKSHLDD